MSKTFIEEVREYVSAATNPFGKGQEFAEALIAIESVVNKIYENDGICPDEAIQYIQKILEGEQK